jgi:hypothetical protein
MNTIKLIFVTIFCALISILTPSCIPTGGGTPVVNDAIAVGEYHQTNILNTALGTTIDGGTVQLNADNTAYIQLKQSIPNQFPFFYDFTGMYTKTGNTVNFSVNYSGSLSIPNPTRTINGTLTLITTVTPNKVRLNFNTTLPIFPSTTGGFIFEK